MTGQELKAWRINRHLTMSAMAQKLGVSITTIYRWESGRTTVHQFLPDRLARLKIR